MSQVKEKDEATARPSRREFLRNFVGLTGIAVVAGAPVAGKVSDALTQAPALNPKVLQVTAVSGPQDPIERMRADMARAMQKPVD